MLKIIPLSSLRVGMFVTRIAKQEKMVGLNQSGKVSSESIIEKMRALGIKKVEIDTSKNFGPMANAKDNQVSQKEKPSHPKAAPNFRLSNALYQEAKQIQSKLLHDIKADRPIDAGKVKKMTERFVSSVFDNSDAMVFMTSMKEKGAYLFEHSVNSSILMSVFAKHLQFDQQTILELATGAFLHDIGKIRIPNEILEKPGKLSEEEFELMKRHVLYGVKAIEKCEELSEISKTVVKQHHERINGLGYPEQLSGEQISQFGRMIAIVDVYDALTAKLNYRDGMTSTNALNTLIAAGGWEFDSELVKSFVECIGLYPVGTLVLLKSGKIGFVLVSNPQDPLLPIVRTFYSAKSNYFTEIKDLNLAKQRTPDQIEKAIEAEEYKLCRREVFERTILEHN